MAEQSPADVVTAMCMALETGDFDQILVHIDPGVVYHNIPWAPVHGHQGVRDVLGALLGDGRKPLKKMEIRHTVASGGIVLNERMEYWDTGKVKVDLPVAGVFEVRDGLITRWADYFDAAAAAPLAGG